MKIILTVSNREILLSTKIKFIAHSSSEEQVHVYLFNKGETHIAVFRDELLSPEMFIGAGYIHFPAVGGWAEFDSLSLKSHVGYDRPHDWGEEKTLSFLKELFDAALEKVYPKV